MSCFSFRNLIPHQLVIDRQGHFHHHKIVKISTRYKITPKHILPTCPYIIKLLDSIGRPLSFSDLCLCSATREGFLGALFNISIYFNADFLKKRSTMKYSAIPKPIEKSRITNPAVKKPF